MRASVPVTAVAGHVERTVLRQVEPTLVFTGTGRARPHPSGSPARPKKTSEVVALDIVNHIVAQQLRIGDRLPPEGAMMSAYGVSRESLREALRILEVQGMLLIRRGPGGGPVVAGVDPAYFARTSSLYFHLAGATYDEVLETWEITEPFLAEKVARTPNRLAVRRALAPFVGHDRREPEPEAFASAPGGFHSVVAEVSHNRVLTLVVQAISHVVAGHVETACPPHDAGQLDTTDHGEIARAIVDGRASKARRLMSDHISRIVEHYRSLFPQRMYDLVEWR